MAVALGSSLMNQENEYESSANPLARLQGQTSLLGEERLSLCCASMDIAHPPHSWVKGGRELSRLPLIKQSIVMNSNVFSQRSTPKATSERAETHRLSDFPFTFHFHAWEKEMATHSTVLAWRIPGTGEPGGLPSLGLHRVGHD